MIDRREGPEEGRANQDQEEKSLIILFPWSHAQGTLDPWLRAYTPRVSFKLTESSQEGTVFRLKFNVLEKSLSVAVCLVLALSLNTVSTS